jgi:hypothetical protein
MKVVENDTQTPTGETSRLVGRPRAKHSSPDYAQMTVYVRKTVRNAVKMRLFQDGLELSALVEKLLQAWLAANDEKELVHRTNSSL